MAKINLPEIGSGYNTTTINSNFRKIQDVVNEKILFRDNPTGEPNQLLTDVDANGKRIYNLPAPVLPHEAARWGEVQTVVNTATSVLLEAAIAKNQAQAAAAEAEADAQEIRGNIALAIEIANSLSNSDFIRFGTKAQAVAGALTEGQFAEVFVDESQEDAHTIYKMVSGSLVLVLNLDTLQIKLASSTGTDAVNGTWFGGVVAPVSDLGKENGAALIAMREQGVGAAIRDLRDMMFDQGISPRSFAPSLPAYHPTLAPTVDHTTCIQQAATAAALYRRKVNLSGDWRITNTVDFTGVNGIDCGALAYIRVDRPEGTDPNSYAMQIGKPGGNAVDRSVFCTINGVLNLDAGNRLVPSNGLYYKGSWAQSATIMAFWFNGIGVNLDSAWDGVFNRIAVEYCGNIQKPAYKFSSLDDTSNTIHVLSLQVEQAFHYCMDIQSLRSVHHNIHNERMYILTLDDGTPANLNGLTYRTHVLSMGNSMFSQAIIHAVDAGFNPPGGGGETTVSGVCNMILYMGNGMLDTVTITGDITIVGGTQGEMRNIVARDVYQMASAFQITWVTPLVRNMMIYEGATIINPRVSGWFRLAYFGANVDVHGGYIFNHEEDATIRGNLRFFGTYFSNCNDPRAPTQSAIFSATQYWGCSIESYVGGYDGIAELHNCKVVNVNLASQSRARFFNCKGEQFVYNGNVGFTTDENCFWTNLVNWSLPLNVPYHKGARTSRPVYVAGLGMDYINADGGVTWVPTFTAPA